MPDSRRKARLWIKIDLGEGRQIGPGKIALLKAIAEQRSIAGAARSLSMSYRRAWLLVDEMNRDLGSPVVETRVGGRGRGGARPTPLGEALVEEFEEITKAAERGAQPGLARLLKRSKTV
jgi:molybdate transport system regulatory protein